ncbi:MAG: LEA type 2 family protein [Candidatus Thiodiazotropha sp. DIVDIV]
MRYKIYRQTISLVFLVTLLMFQGCSTLEQAGTIISGQQPTAQVKDVKLSGLDLNGIDLIFNLQVDNPNPVKIVLDHLDYDLKLSDRSFLKGEQGMGMNLVANGASQVKLPVRMEFEQLLKQYGQLEKQDEVPYEIDLGLGFDVPLLGRIRLPVNYEGRLPIPKMPDVKLSYIEVKRLTLQKADLMVELEVANPNQFAVMLDKLDYQLKLNGIDVGGGALSQSMKIDQRGRGRITLPLSLDMMQAGRGLYGAFIGGSGLRYELDGSLDASGDTPILGEFQIPLDRQGKVDLN